MMAANEVEALRRYQTDPGPDTLRTLLTAHQHRIYNACFQVLRRAEDAEDAAQDALLKVADGARAARDADSLRGWIYRVSLRVALDHWRRREATRARESRAAMNRTEPPLDDRERLALFEAIDGLEDRERALLLEHYFEKVSLPELGERRGISAVAVWKVIDRAREKLKKLLLAAGFAAFAGRVAEALESSVPAAAPPSLMAGAVSSQILAGGGVVSAAKGSIVATAAIVAILSIVGVVALISSPKEEKPAETGGLRAPESETTFGPGTLSEGKPTAPVEEPAVPKSPGEGLRETLQRYKTWVAAWKSSADARQAADHRRQARKEFKEARALILEDPETFLAFLKDPAHQEVGDTLTGDLLLQIEEREDRQVVVRHPLGSFPTKLMEGLTGLLKTGSDPLRRDILFFLFSVDERSDEMNLAVSELAGHRDFELQYWAVAALAGDRRPLGATIESRLMDRVIFRGEPDVKAFALQALGRSERPEVRTWMLDSLESNRDPQLLAPLAEGAVMTSLKGTGETESFDRLVGLLTGALKSGLPESDARRLLSAAIRLPTPQVTRIFQAAQYKPLAPKLVAAISAVLDRIARGDGSTEKLQSAFAEALK